MDAPKFLGTYPFADSGNSSSISIELDESVRKKIYTMKGNTLKLYLHLIILKNKDEKFVYLKDREEFMLNNRIKANLTINSSLKELVDSKLIAYTGQRDIFWINHNYTKC